MATNMVRDSVQTLEYTNAGSAITSGAVVVVGSQVCVALVDIANGATGTVARSGEYNLPKADAAVIAQGEAILWDSSAGNFDDGAAIAAAGDVIGGCIAGEAKGATTSENIKVILNVGVGTVS